MKKVLWSLPLPAGCITRGVRLEERKGREIVLSFDYEEDDVEGTIRHCELKFQSVVHFRTTYLPALTLEMVSTSYNDVVELQSSDILSDVVVSMSEDVKPRNYKHYRITFDDGPCYDLIASDFTWIIA